MIVFILLTFMFRQYLIKIVFMVSNYQVIVRLNWRCIFKIETKTNFSYSSFLMTRPSQKIMTEVSRRKFEKYIKQIAAINQLQIDWLL